MIITNYQLGVAGGKIIEDASAVANLNQLNIRHGMAGIPTDRAIWDTLGHKAIGTVGATVGATVGDKDGVTEGATIGEADGATVRDEPIGTVGATAGNKDRATVGGTAGDKDEDGATAGHKTTGGTDGDNEIGDTDGEDTPASEGAEYDCRLGAVKEAGECGVVDEEPLLVEAGVGFGACFFTAAPRHFLPPERRSSLLEVQSYCAC